MKDKTDFIPALGYDQLTALYDKVIDWTMPEKKFRVKLIGHMSPQPDEKISEFDFVNTKIGTLRYLIATK